VLRMLSGYYPFVRPLLDWDRDSGELRGRSAARMAALSGAGTIPSSANYPVVHGDTKLTLGDLEEEFVHESSVGDMFRLGAHSWMIRDIRHDRVVVTETANRFSEVPFWRGDAGGRSFELGERIGAFVRELRERIARDSDEAVCAYLAGSCGFDARAAQELVDLIRRQDAVSRMPTDRCIVVETYEDVTGQTHVVVHNYWGRRVNRAWLTALQHVWEESLPHPPYANAKDNGIELVFRSWQQGSLPLLWSLAPETAERTLRAAAPQSAAFAVAFRRIAETSLLLHRGFSRVPSWQKRIRAEELLKAALPFASEFPPFGAALEECLTEAMDLGGLLTALRRLADGTIEVVSHAGDAPSPLAAQFALDYVAQMLYEGDAPSEELRRHLRETSRDLAAAQFGEERLRLSIEPDVLEREAARLSRGGRDVAGPSDLLPLLKRRGDLSAEQLAKIAGPDAVSWAEALAAEGKAAKTVLAGEERYISRDELETYARFPGDPSAAAFVLLRYIDGVVAFTADELTLRFGLTPNDAAARIAAWAAEGRIEPAPFEGPDSRYWTSRSVAARLVRLSLGAVRTAAAPVPADRWQRLLLARHGLVRPSAERGPEALRAALAPLQGLFLPATLWESALLPARLPGFRPEDLDLLCASGELTWLGRRSSGEREGQFAPVRNFLLARGKLHPKLGSGHGRWYAVEPPERSAPLDQTRALAWAKQLLRAFGGVTGAIANAYAPFGWDAALPLFKQLEEWGVAARGLFVEGVPALQFMDPDTIAALRGWEREAEPPAGTVLVSAADPAVPYGVAVPWPDAPGASFARKSSNHLVFVDGAWTYWLESNGKHIVRIGEGDADGAALLPVLKLLLRRGGLKRIRVETWNGRRAADAALPLLERGTERDRDGLVLWPSQLG